MIVHCPHCLTGYELPPSLMGKHGARVRCPGCHGVFVVLPEESVPVEARVPGGEVLPEPMSHVASGVTQQSAAPAAVAAPPEPVPTPPLDPALVAGAVLDVMADFLGEALRRSRERGTVLSDHGPAILAVFDEYRRRAGADAPAAHFRVALRDRCGVDLTPRA